MMMRRRIAVFLRKIAEWLDPIPLAAPIPASRVQELMDEQDARWNDRSGEAKRHQVLARLVKEFPTVRERELGLIIEQLMQGRG